MTDALGNEESRKTVSVRFSHSLTRPFRAYGKLVEPAPYVAVAAVVGKVGLDYGPDEDSFGKWQSDVTGCACPEHLLARLARALKPFDVEIVA